MQTNGPYVEGVKALAGSDRDLFAGTAYNGIYVSRDSGRTWTGSSAGLEYTYGQSKHVPTVTDIEIVGSNAFAGTYFAGVYLSTNGGASWSQVNTGLTSTNVRLLHAAGALLLAGTSDARLFTTKNSGLSWTVGGAGIPKDGYMNSLASSGSRIYGGTTRGVYVSIDEGATWVAANTGLPSSAYVLALAVQGSKIFASLYGRGVYVSSNGGGSWTATGMSWPFGVGSPPDVIDLLVAGDTLFAASRGDGVFLSSDQGVSWAPMNDGLADRKVEFLERYGEKIFAQAELGLYVAPGRGGTWAQSPTPEVSVTSFEAFASDGNRLFAVAARNNVFLTTDLGMSWTWQGRPVADFHAYCLALAGQTLLIGGTCTVGRVERSIDGGVSWNTALDTTGYPIGGRFNAEALVARGSEVLAGGNGVWRSTDEGVAWNRIMSVLPSLNYVWTLAFLDSFMFAGGNYGVYSLRGSDTAWVFAGTGLASPSVKCLAASGRTLLAGTFGKGIFRTTDLGASWRPANTGLTDSTILCLAVAGEKILAGTETQGVFLSMDDGASWEAVNAGLKGRAIYALAIHGPYAFAGTGDGNGASRRLVSELVGGDPEEESPAAYALEQNFPNPFNPRTTINFTLPGPSEVRLTVYDLLGRQVALLVDGNRDAGVHQVTFDAPELASGVYIYRLRAGEYVRSRKMLILK